MEVIAAKVDAVLPATLDAVAILVGQTLDLLSGADGQTKVDVEMVLKGSDFEVLVKDRVNLEFLNMLRVALASFCMKSLGQQNFNHVEGDVASLKPYLPQLAAKIMDGIVEQHASEKESVRSANPTAYIKLIIEHELTLQKFCSQLVIEAFEVTDFCAVNDGETFALRRDGLTAELSKTAATKIPDLCTSYNIEMPSTCNFTPRVDLFPSERQKTNQLILDAFAKGHQTAVDALCKLREPVRAHVANMQKHFAPMQAVVPSIVHNEEPSSVSTNVNPKVVPMYVHWQGVVKSEEEEGDVHAVVSIWKVIHLN